MNWRVYMILCTDNSLYTGITNNVERRWSRHAAQRGAKYFRSRQPGQVVYLESGHTRRSASQREATIKKMRRVDKDRLIASALNEAPGRFLEC
ncbi:MAG: GIY-YIG nuclease family protein [Acidiferrobacterales bacterium]